MEQEGQSTESPPFSDLSFSHTMAHGFIALCCTQLHCVRFIQSLSYCAIRPKFSGNGQAIPWRRQMSFRKPCTQGCDAQGCLLGMRYFFVFLLSHCTLAVDQQLLIGWFLKSSRFLQKWY